MSEARLKKSIEIIGAGFSGLSLAYYLRKKHPQLEIKVWEKDSQVGGRLQSVKTPYGVVERAANGILDSDELREMAREIGIDLLEASPGIKRAYFLKKGRLRSWPFNIFQSIAFFFRAFLSFLDRKNFEPRPMESMSEWSERNLGREAARYLVDPALAGIYAAPLESLSSRLILSRFFQKKKKAGKKKKFLTVAPRGGMQEFANHLKSWLESQGVKFCFEQEVAFKPSEEIRIFCGSLSEAQGYLSAYRKMTEFADLSMLPVSTTTMFFKKALPYKAFGVLYPRIEKRSFLGTLLNSQIFPARYKHSSETWIRSDLKTEEQTQSEILAERKALFSDEQAPLAAYSTQWKGALPHYNLKLEVFLAEHWPSLKSELKAKQLYLHGNYLGKLGLSQLLIASRELADEISL